MGISFAPSKKKFLCQGEATQSGLTCLFSEYQKNERILALEWPRMTFLHIICDKTLKVAPKWPKWRQNRKWRKRRQKSAKVAKSAKKRQKCQINNFVSSRSHLPTFKNFFVKRS